LGTSYPLGAGERWLKRFSDLAGVAGLRKTQEVKEVADIV